eukprot:267457_1
MNTKTETLLEVLNKPSILNEQILTQSLSTKINLKLAITFIITISCIFLWITGKFNFDEKKLVSNTKTDNTFQLKSSLQSCLGRPLECEGSFDFNTGHIKMKSDGYLYQLKSKEFYVYFSTKEIMNKSRQCFGLNAYDLYKYDNNFRFKHPRYRTEYHWRSKLFENILIYYHLFNITNSRSPYFIELGGHDGITESNTAILDFCLNWNGMLIEGNPRIYTKLMDNRPSTTKMLLAPSCLDDNLGIKFSSSLSSTMSGISGVVEYRGYIDYVHCGPLQIYFNDLNIKHIEYFSLDVEGSENSVLQTIDFQKTQIDIMEIEAYNRMCRNECPKRDQFRQFMIQQHGYNVIHDMVPRDDVFVNPHSQFCKFLTKRIIHIHKIKDDTMSFADIHLQKNSAFIEKICKIK